MQIPVSKLNLKHEEKLINDFGYFIDNIFWKSFDKYTPAPHLQKWAKELQNNRNTAILSARKHLKSTIIYAYIMWLIYTTRGRNVEILYLSFKEELARYHIANIKKYIEANPEFDCSDLTNANSEIKYTWSKSDYEKIQHKITVHPAGVLSFKRGYHPDIVICDDILADPSQELNLTIIDKINRVFFEDIMSLPKEGGEIKLVGTAQHQEDLFFKLKEKKNWSWSSNQAILNEQDKLTLWPEMFTFERLMEIRDMEVGEKAFQKEYMCSPVWSEDAYFKREDIMNCVDSGLHNITLIDNPVAQVVAGLDIGKVRHPSHFTVFLHSNGLIIQIYQCFMDGWDYTKQIDHIKAIMDGLKIKRIFYDDTRSELESFLEQGVIQRGVWKGIKFTQSEKFKLAANFSKVVSKGIIKLQNNSRQIRSILSVNNNLEALETSDGHGDAFWSVALALNYRPSQDISIVGAGHFR